ncbi:MAG: hypothetical protein RRY29_03760 [Desulfovibrionaceae bacterium]
MKFIHIVMISFFVILLLVVMNNEVKLAQQQKLVTKLEHELAQCSAALKSAKSTAADLREQGTMSQANCVDSLLAAQGLFELALPPAIPTEQGTADVTVSAVPPVNSSPREVNDAAFTTFLNTF